MTTISDENITENATDGTDDQSLVTSAVVSEDTAQYLTLALDMPASILVTSVNGWIVIQQRMDGSTSFNRTWVDYKNGFGTYNRNFWLGLESMYRITASGVYRLRFEFETITGKWLSAEYDTFNLDGGAAYYTLHVSGYSGDGGDWLNANDTKKVHNGMPFSTYDADHDKYPYHNCASDIGGGGGFWYNSCSWIKLHGIYGTPTFQIATTSQSNVFKLSISRMMIKAI